MSELKNFDYDGQSISFEFSDGNKMINATQMAKPFGKPVGNFLRLKETKEYIALLEKRYSDMNIDREVLRVIKGGDTEQGLQGTWMDEKLALKFAAWLSPMFELWVYDRIQELLTEGQTQLKSFTPSGIIQGLRLIVEQLEEQEKFNQVIREDVDYIADRVDDLEAKIVSSDENYYTIAGYCSLNKIPCPLHKAKEWGKLASKRSKEMDVPMGTAHDERYGKVRTYHTDILAAVIVK